jgi:hypothetical protein
MPAADHDGARSDVDIAALVGRIGNLYVRQRLSPPAQLCAAAIRHWLGLSVREIVAVLERHFDEYRREYRSGSGDGLFWMVQRAMQEALASKHPCAQVAEPERSARPRRRRMMSIPTIAGAPADVLVDDPTAPLPRDRAGPRERISSLPGYETSGEPIGGIEDEN